MRVYLDGEIYELKAGTGILRTPLVEFPDNIRLDGQQKRKDRSYLSSWAIDNWSGGLCLERINVDITAHQSRLWDAENVDTRRQSQITLSPAFNNCTMIPSVNMSAAHIFTWENELYLVGLTGYAYKYTASTKTFGSHNAFPGTHTDNNTVLGTNLRAILNAQDSLKAIAQGAQDAGANTYVRYFHSLGIGSLPVHSKMYNPATDANRCAEMLNLGGTIHVLAYNVTDKRYDFWISPAMQGSISVHGTAPGIEGSYISPMITDGVDCYAALPHGIYDFDESPVQVLDTSNKLDRNCLIDWFNNEITLKNKKQLISFDPSSVELTSIGYDKDDGLPSDKWGEITAITSSFAEQFCAVKGGTYSHILSRVDSAWQYYARVPSPGLWIRKLFLSNSPDGIDRLWCIYGNYAYPGYFYNPLTNPLQAGTYPFVGTGHFTPPIYDGGIGEERGGFYDQIITADKIYGNNKITALYGLDSASPVTTLGVVGTGTEILMFGSPYGIEGYRIQPKFLMTGDNTGTSPIFRNNVLHYLKLPRARESFDFTIDLKQTAYSQVKPLEAIIGSLNYERDKRTLMPFWYGMVATKLVKILNEPASEDLEDQKIYEGERSGFIRIVCAEIT